MSLAALLCLAIGLAPSAFYALLPYPVGYEPYSLRHTLEVLQVMAGTAVGFLALRRWLGAKHAVTLDFDRAYRALGRGVAQLSRVLARALDALEDAVGDGLSRGPSSSGRVPAPPLAYAVLASALAFGGLLAALFV